MNKKQETDLKIISGIDGEIIDKNSQKRYELLTKKKIKKWIIPSSVAAVIVLAIMVPILILLFAKQVPIYEGMTVSNYKPASSAENVVDEREPHRFSYLSNTNGNNGNGNGNNGNHYGQNKKPVDEIVEEDTSIGIEIPEQPMYYAKAGQEIYITVHISNPDSFEILSFTLNGKKYSSYMFEEGSDMENLILKVTVPADAEGVIDYTIDAIKYVDGTDIKDVDMRGERTVKVGVYTSKQPKATVSDELVRINDVSFDVTLSDGLGLIERCGGKAFAVVVDGDTLLSYEEITVGDEHITFVGLDTYTSYRYGVVAYYDALDGKGMDVKILFEKEFTTQSVVAPDNIVKTQTSVEFGLIFNELYEDKNVTSISLYHGEDKVKDFDVSGDALAKTFSATELLSNNEYTIVISYINVGATETVEFNVTTEAKATPDFEITETEKTQTSFKFDITVTDIDAVGAITKLELIHGEDVTNVEDLTARELTNLLSNNDYTVKVTYTYDLNDGVGEHTIEKTLDVKTEEKVEPTFTLKDVTSTRYEINGSYDQTNVDDTLISYVVELYKGNELVKANDDKEIKFDSLDYYTDYTVKITYTFDVNDGKGVQTKTVEQEIKTLPYIDAKSMSVRSTGIVFEGDKVYLQITLNNPCGATVNTVVINGEEYAVSAASNANVLLVDIENKGQFASGNVTLTLEGFLFTLDGVDYTAASETRCSDTAKMVTRVEIVSIEYVDSELNPSVWMPKVAQKEEHKRFILVTLNGDQFGEIKNILLRIEANDVFNELELTPEEVQNLGDGRFLITIPDLTDDMLIDPWGVPTVTLVCGNEYIDNYTISAKGEGSIIIDRYITVSTVEEFVSLGDSYKPMYVELTADLDLSDVENFYGIDFVGVFDGKGHTITNFSVVGKVTDSSYVGLFNRFNGELRNLTLDDSLYLVEFAPHQGSGFTYEYSGVGGLVGWFEGGEINNCTVGSNVLISSSDPQSLYISYSGGIIGYANTVRVRIINCKNYATVGAADAEAVGGIAGRFENGAISNCKNSGEISGGSYVGGIAGYSNRVINNCENSGKVSGEGDVGGIAGSSGDGVINNCVNGGEISGTERVGGISGCGGNISYCINRGNVSSIGNEDEFATEAGGIVGSSGGDTVSNCENYGNVSGINAVGGIAGDCNGNISDCVNSGKVSGDGDYIGGIAGISGDVTINDCVNRGDVSGYSVIGGIVGSNITADIKNCQNYANISGVYGVDGICGGQNGTVENCEDHGTVTIKTDDQETETE